jgi:hypothetical protein
MKSVFHLAAVLLCSFSLNAQITTALHKPPNRSPEIVIRNHSTANLTAFAVSMAVVAEEGLTDRAPFLVYIDTAVDTDRLALSYPPGTAMPLPPNEEYAVPVNDAIRTGKRVDLFRPPIVTAGVFADGTTAGDAALLGRLMVRRSNMLQAVELAREVISDAGRHNVSRGRLIDQF